MTLLSGWPAVVDDSGGGKDGTPINKAWSDAAKAEIEDKIHSTTNASETPKGIIDEAVTFRGNTANMNARVSNVIDADGNLITPASIVTAAQLQDIMGFQNLVPMNADQLMWQRGAALAPTGFTLSGTGATIARTGVGEGDTWTVYGPYGSKVTYGSATAELVIPILDTAAMVSYLKGEYFGFGAKVRSSIASHARLFVNDGVSKQYSDYQSDAGSDQWLSKAVQISAAATKLELGFSVEQSGAAYVDGWTLGLGNRAPTRFVPPRMGVPVFQYRATTPSTGDGKTYWHAPFPWIITHVYAIAATAPSGNVTIDIERSNSTGWVSIFSGAKNILASGEKLGVVTPDGTYENRCVAGTFTDGGTDLSNADDSILRLNIDATNGVGGLLIEVGAKGYLPTLLSHMAYDDLSG